MFTIKLYRDSGFRQLILEAESFTVLRTQNSGVEITLHRPQGPNGEYRDVRYDLGDCGVEREFGFPEIFERAIIENANGKTTEIISLPPSLSKATPRAA